MNYIKELRVQYIESDRPNLVEGQVRSSQDVYELFKDLEDDAKEKLLALYLDTSLKVNSFEVLFVGSENACLLTPKQIFKGALLTNSPCFILIHNHPTGDSTPSKADSDLINRIKRVALDMDLHFLDFVIIGKDQHWSWRSEAPHYTAENPAS